MRHAGVAAAAVRRPRQGLPLPLPLRMDARGYSSSSAVTLRGIKLPPPFHAYASARLALAQFSSFSSFSSSSSSSASPEVTHSSSSSPLSVEELLAGGEPEPPGESECCGNGCDDCVWIEYWERLEDYKRAKAQVEDTAAAAAAAAAVKKEEGGREGGAEGAWEPAAAAPAVPAAVRPPIAARVKGREDDH